MTSYFLSSSTIFFVILDAIMDEVLKCKDILSSICTEGPRAIFFLLIKKTENKRENKSPYFNSLSRRVDFSPLNDTRSDWIKAARTNFDPLQSRSTWQIYSSKKSLYIQAQILSTPFSVLFFFLSLFCSPFYFFLILSNSFFLCFLLLSTSFFLCFLLKEKKLSSVLRYVYYWNKKQRSTKSRILIFY